MMSENYLTAILVDPAVLRSIESNIYSVLPYDETGSAYDSHFGLFYDLAACNPLYNRVVWGYSVRIFQQIAEESLQSSPARPFLDLACGSLAFTASIYKQYPDRPIVLVDQSLKMLRKPKAKLINEKSAIAEKVVFLHADALNLPFKENTFTTILSENLLHCLADANALLRQLQSLLAENGKMFFTTLVRTGRLADRYLETLADSGYLVARTAADHKKIFAQVGLSATYESRGNILIIKVAG